MSAYLYPWETARGRKTIFAALVRTVERLYADGERRITSTMIARGTDALRRKVSDKNPDQWRLLVHVLMGDVCGAKLVDWKEGKSDAGRKAWLYFPRGTLR